MYIENYFQGKLELYDPAVTDTLLLELDGVHFTKNGSFYASAQEAGYVTTTRLPEGICLTQFQVFIHRHTIHPELCSGQRTERYRFGHTGRDDPSPIEAEECG
jgi:hypothetical protein